MMKSCTESCVCAFKLYNCTIRISVLNEQAVPCKAQHRASLSRSELGDNPTH